MHFAIFARKSAFVFFFILATALLIISKTEAATLTPDIFTDDYDTIADADCSLREAIQSINNGSDFGGCTASGSYGASDTVTLSTGTYNLTIAGNENSNTQGDLDINTNMTITGAGMNNTIIDAGGSGGTAQDRVMHVTGAYTVSINDLTLTGGYSTASTSGGGLFLASTPNVSLNGVKVDSNTVINAVGVCRGAGIYIAGGSLTIQNSEISNNDLNLVFSGSATCQGSGIYASSSTINISSTSISNNAAIGSIVQGGGIYSSGSGDIIIDTTTINNNTLTGTALQGGGYYYSRTSGTATVTNSTISENTSNNGRDLYFSSANSLSFLNVTITSSTAASTIFAGGSGTIDFQNSIINGDCADSGSLINSLGNNIESGTTCSFSLGSDLQSTDPLLNALASNGGSTQTHALQSTSPAIDVGDDASCPSTDQRGETRTGYTADGDDDATVTCDIGAYEYQGSGDAAREAAEGSGGNGGNGDGSGTGDGSGSGAGSGTGTGDGTGSGAGGIQELPQTAITDHNGQLLMLVSSGLILTGLLWYNFGSRELEYKLFGQATLSDITKPMRNYFKMKFTTFEDKMEASHKQKARVLDS